MTAFLNTLGLIAACVLIALWCAVSLLFSVASVLIFRSFEGLAEGLASARQAFLPAVRRLASWFIRRSSWCVDWLRSRRRPLVRFIEYLEGGLHGLGVPLVEPEETSTQGVSSGSLGPRITAARDGLKRRRGSVIGPIPDASHVATLEDGDQWICDWAGKAIIVNPDRPPRVVQL